MIDRIDEIAMTVPPVDAARPTLIDQLGDIEITTDLGGCLYLINLGLFLGLYGDFTTPLSPGIDLPIWDFIALLACELLSAEAQDDPLWSLLAQLAGRADDEPPGRDFAPPDGSTQSVWLATLRARLRTALNTTDEELPRFFRAHARVVVSDLRLAAYLALAELPIEIRQSAVEEGTWIATIPFLGAATFMGVGDTREEALAQLDEAREFNFEAYLENGIAIPDPPSREDDDAYSGRFLLRISKALHRRLAYQAASNGVSLNHWAAKLLAEGAEASARQTDYTGQFRELLRDELAAMRVQTGVPAVVTWTEHTIEGISVGVTYPQESKISWGAPNTLHLGTRRIHSGPRLPVVNERKYKATGV